MQSVPRIHAVTNEGVQGSPQFAGALQSLSGSTDLAVHLRSSAASARELMAWANRVRAAGLPMIVNDRVDVAVATHSDGIHLPSAGIPITRVRELVGPTVLVGKSTHSALEARQAFREGADYVFLGPIWETPSHPGWVGLGPGAIGEVGEGRVVAIGGIDPARARECAAAGAWGVAAITAIWHARDPSGVASRLLLPFTVNG